MKKRLSFAMVLGVAALLAGCQGPCDKMEPITGPQLSGGSADFGTYVSMGTSISSGWQSGGLVQTHQKTSFPALFAQQIGKTVLASGQGQFTFPAVSSGGYPPLLELRSLSPLIISNSGRPFGAPANNAQTTAYHNMAVPYSVLYDAVDTSGYYATQAPLFRPSYQFFFFENAARHRGTILAQALSLAPTFMSIELGANELLGYGTSGGTSAIFPPASYAAVLTQVVNAIHTLRPDCKVALFNPPQPATIPFFTTFSPITVRLSDGAPISLIGETGDGPTAGPLSASDLVLLTAKDSIVVGTGIPVGAYNYLNPAAPGNGRPLPDAMVLDAGEQSNIQTAWNQMAAAVDSVSLRPFVTKVDLNGLLQTVATSGLQVGATHYSKAYVTGGLFSLDGVHPNDLAHALVCNTMIDAVNARFGSTVPKLNLWQYATPSSSRSQPVGPDGLEGMTLEGLDERSLGFLRLRY